MDIGIAGFNFTFFFVILINLLVWGIRIFIAVLLIMVLLKYLKEKQADKQDTEIKKSLGEVLKERRVHAQLTQEYVAEALGVSRQAVSKWENGTSDPSTTNLIKLSKLYGISPDELLRSVQSPDL